MRTTEAGTAPTGWPIRSSAANRALIVVLAFAAYWPVFSAGFIWDDLGHVTRPELRSLSGLARIWFEPGATQQYYPLLHSAFWLEHRLWGDSAFGYHLLNVVLHAVAACLLGTLLNRLRIPGAWLAALLFAVHPVCVESVAWIAEQKNTLSTVFYLCAALSYLRFDETRRSQDYAIASALFIAAVLTKTLTATLPATLLVFFWWRRGALSWRSDVRPLLPWFVFALVAGFGTAWFERTLIGAQGADFSLTLAERLLLAARIPWFYLGKLIWPAELAFIYPRWSIAASDPSAYAFAAATVAALAALWWWRQRQRAPLAAVLLFGGSLFPALGFVNVFPFIYSYVADHFQYLAMIGVVTLAAAGLSRLKASNSLGMAALGALAVLTWQHAKTFRTAEILYRDVLRKNPASWMAHNNLAILLFESGRAAEAIPHYEAALRHRPRYAEASRNLGAVLNELGRPEEALPHFERALQWRPDYAEAHNDRGVSLLALGRHGAGLDALRTAIRLRPGYARAHLNLGLALSRAGDHEQALGCFQRAQQLEPTNPEAELYLGIALQTKGRIADALVHFRRALDLRPEWGVGHFHLALALRQLGREEEARSHLREAEELGFRPPGYR